MSTPVAWFNGLAIKADHSAYKTLITGKLVPPTIFDDLASGIRSAHKWLLDPWVPADTRKVLHIWAAQATELLDQVNLGTLPTAAYPTIKYPEHCKVCNHHNPYAGAEHMTPCGLYVCRQCRPAWDRKERMAVMKEEEALREAKKAICG